MWATSIGPDRTATNAREIDIVEGVLEEYSPAFQKMLRQRAAQVVEIPTMRPVTPRDRTIVKRMHERRANQLKLRDLMSVWAGCFPNEDRSTLQRRFYHQFGVDAMTAQTLGGTRCQKPIPKITKLP